MVIENQGLCFASKRETEGLEEGKGAVFPYPTLTLGLPDHHSSQ